MFGRPLTELELFGATHQDRLEVFFGELDEGARSAMIWPCTSRNAKGSRAPIRKTIEPDDVTARSGSAMRANVSGTYEPKNASGSWGTEVTRLARNLVP